MSTVPGFIHDYRQRNIHRQHYLLREAVCCWDNPAVWDDGSSTLVNSIVLQADLPRPTALSGVHTTNNTVCCKTPPATVYRGERGEREWQREKEIKTYVDRQTGAKTRQKWWWFSDWAEKSAKKWWWDKQKEEEKQYRTVHYIRVWSTKRWSSGLSMWNKVRGGCKVITLKVLLELEWVQIWAHILPWHSSVRTSLLSQSLEQRQTELVTTAWQRTRKHPYFLSVNWVDKLKKSAGEKTERTMETAVPHMQHQTDSCSYHGNNESLIFLP